MCALLPSCEKPKRFKDLPEEKDKIEYKYEENVENTVYVSKSGGKIHYNENCSNMKYYTSMSESEAIRRGYSYCQNCT
jgi:hypothetical protein